MGLDNSITLNTKINVEKVPYKFLRERMSLFGDVCYWRKCWGIRREIYNKLHFQEENIGGGLYKLDREDIPAIIRIILSFIDNEKWDRDADSIWEFEEIKDILVYDVVALEWLHEYWGKHPDLEVEFVDSY